MTAIEPFQPITDIVYTTDQTLRSRPVMRRFLCTYPECGERFYQMQQYLRHESLVHVCAGCRQAFISLNAHQCFAPVLVGAGNSVPASNLPAIINPSFKIQQTAHNSNAVVLDREFDNVLFGNFADCFEFVNKDVTDLIQQFIVHHNGAKVSISLFTTLERASDKLLLKRKFIGPFLTFVHTSFIQDRLKTAAEYLNISLDMYMENGSGWVLKTIHSMEVRILAYQPDLRRGEGYIPLPKALLRKGIININSKNDCFIYCVVSKLYRENIHFPGLSTKAWHELGKNEKRKLKRRLEYPGTYREILKKIHETGEMNFQQFYGGVTVSDIPRFEELNLVSINAYEYNGKKLYPIYISEGVSNRHVDLLLLSKPTDGGKEYHWCLLDLGKMAGKRNHRAAEVCHYCFGKFRSENYFNHMQKCQVMFEKTVIFPKEDYYSFQKFQMYQTVNYKIYFKLIKFEEKLDKIPGDPIHLKYTTTLGNTEVAGYSIVIVDYDNNLYFTNTYCGLYAMEKFMQTIMEQIDIINERVHNTNIDYVITSDIQHELMYGKTCRICKVDYHSTDRKNNTPCVHHQHISSKFQRTIVIYKECNIKIQKSAVVAVSHNFSHVDGPLIIRSLRSEWIQYLKLTAKNSENIVSFTFLHNFNSQCRFIDSKLFLDNSIEELFERLDTSYNSEEKDVKHHLINQFFNDDTMRKIAKTTVAFPWNETFKVDFDLGEGFPGIKHFNSVTLAVYDQSLLLYKHSGCFSMYKYAEFFLQVSSLQLGEVMTNLDVWCMKNFNLSPLHNQSLSGFAHDACFAISKAKYEFVKSTKLSNS